MNASSPRFKSLAVTAGLSFWFFIITSSTEVFSIEILIIFVAIILSVTQIFVKKISRGLDIIATINTKIFLGILESIHPEDAKLVVKMINKEQPAKGITSSLVKEVFPSLI